MRTFSTGLNFLKGVSKEALGTFVVLRVKELYGCPSALRSSRAEPPPLMSPSKEVGSGFRVGLEGNGAGSASEHSRDSAKSILSSSSLFF